MKELRINSKIKDRDLDYLTSFASKRDCVTFTFIRLDNKSIIIKLEVSKRPKGYSRVLIDIYGSNWDVSAKGRESFKKYERNLLDPDDRKEVFCGKRVMRIDVKKTGESVIFAYMLNFLEDKQNFENIKPW